MADLFEPDVELHWRGKETRVKTVSLPFQTVERIDLRGLGDLGHALSTSVIADRRAGTT